MFVMAGSRKRKEPSYNWVRRINIELNKKYKPENWEKLNETERALIEFANDFNRNQLRLQFAMLQKSVFGYPTEYKGRIGIFRPLEACFREKLGDIRSKINLTLEQATELYENMTLEVTVDAYLTEAMMSKVME